MLSLGRFQWRVQSNVLQQVNDPTWKHLQFSSRSNFPVLCGSKFSCAKSRTGLHCSAFNAKKKGGFSGAEKGFPVEIDDDFDAEWMDFEDDEIEEEEEDDDGDEDDEVFIPLENMKKWEANKPRGFGEGKVYDTSIEDKLIEEIEQSRKAQLLNINRLKNKAINSSPENQGSANMEDGYQVRLLNLPKKKNIHRDLQLAFNGVPGMLKILPVVSGNKKTRDPICKGLAFISFKYEDQAQRFVQNFSGKNIVFGKVEKQIKCEVVTPASLRDAFDQPVTEALDEGDETTLSEEIDTADEDEIDGNTELIAGHESNASSYNSLEHETSQGIAKKAKAKRRKDKSKTLTRNSILGAANRLKTREKAMLTGVLSKYGGSSTATTKVSSSD